MADFTILGRVEKRAGNDYRATAAAIPNQRGRGPVREDIRMARARSAAAARCQMGLLVHALATAVLARGDQLVKLDVK
jgi:hypothetical protein